MKTLKGVGVLIGAYLVLEYATGASKLFSSAGTAGVGVVKTLQGR